MKDFLGSFADGVSGLVQSYIFPSVVAAGLWSFFVLPDGDADPDGVYSVVNGLSTGQAAIALAATAVVLSLALGVVTGSATRLLEGYWWGRGTDSWIGKLWRRRSRAMHRKRRDTIQRVNELAAAGTSRSVIAERQREKAKLAGFPIYPELTLPTHLGNRLRNGEGFGLRVFGIDVILHWDGLLANCPEFLRDQVTSRRSHLDLFTSCWVLSLAFIPASIHAAVTEGWSLPGYLALVGCSAGTAIASYFGSVMVASSYAGAIAQVAALGRVPYATALGYQVPETSEAERDFWTALSGIAFFADSAAESAEWRSLLSSQRFSPPKK